MYILWLLILLPLMGMVLFKSRAEAMSPREQLQQVRKEIAEKQQLLSRTIFREKESLQKITASEAKAKRQRARAEAAARKANKLRNVIAIKVQEVGREKTAREQRQQDWMARILGVQRVTGKLPNRQRILAPLKFSNEQFARHTAMLSAIDRGEISRREVQIHTLTAIIGQIRGEKQRQDADCIAGQQELAQAEQEKATETTALEKVRQEKIRIYNSIKEMESRQQRLQSLIAQLQQRDRKKVSSKRGKNKEEHISETLRQGTLSLPSWFNKFNLPVNGKLIRHYGLYRHPVYQTTTFSNGIYIQAPVGSDVRSIAPGKVIFSAPLKGYGNLLVVDHNDTIYSLYANCSSLQKKVGEQVGRNEIVARAGNLEGQEGSGLYFELRRKGKTLNPMKWVQSE